MPRLKETAQRGNTYPNHGTCPNEATHTRNHWICPNEATHTRNHWNCPNGATYTRNHRNCPNGATHTRNHWNYPNEATHTRNHRNCPNGATHTSLGCNPGTRIREKRCVLKERRIGSAVVEVRGAEICGVPSERGFLYPGGFPGFAPWAGMRCPFRAWDRERGAMPRWWHGIGNVVLAWDRNAIVLNF